MGTCVPDIPATNLVTVFRKKMTIPIDPALQHVPEEGVFDYLCGNRKKYLDQLGGILLGWEIVKLRMKSKEVFPFRPLVNVKGNFTVLTAVPGDKLQGCVLEIRPSFIICRSLNIFCVKVPCDIAVSVGDVIEYMFERYDNEDKLPIIYGTDPVIVPNGTSVIVNGLPMKHETTVNDNTDDYFNDSHDDMSFSNKRPVYMNIPVDPRIVHINADAASHARPVSGKRKPEMTAAEPTSKRQKQDNETLPHVAEMRAVAQSTPLNKSAGKKADALPVGWERIKHDPKKEGGKVWYTYKAPDGKVFPKLNKAMAYLAAKGGSNETPSKASNNSTKPSNNSTKQPNSEVFKVKVMQILESSDLKKRTSEQLKKFTNHSGTKNGSGMTSHLPEDNAELSRRAEANQEEDVFASSQENEETELAAEYRNNLLQNLEEKLKKPKKKKKKKESSEGFL